MVEKIDSSQTRVIDIIWGSDSKLVFLRTENGNTLYMSLSHPIITNRGQVQAGELNASDIIVTKNGDSRISELYIVDTTDTEIYSLVLKNEGAIYYNDIAGGYFNMQNNDLRKTSVATSQEATALAKEFERLYVYLEK